MLLATQAMERNYYFIFSNGLIWWILIGLLAGWIAGVISRGRGFGCLVNIFLGLVGAVIGGWIFTKLHIATYGFIGSLAAAVVGAVILVAIARLFSGNPDA
jgi:uncharacterized membrane protein YeaQ/YmgE (transglycosylase-associated protein family)